jgi:hypothetical protein
MEGFMKKFVSGFALVLLIGLLISCTTTTHPWDSPSVNLGINESNLHFVNRIGMGRIRVTINGQTRIINDGAQEKLIIPNGSYLIEAKTLDRRFGKHLNNRNANLHLSVNSEYVVFEFDSSNWNNFSLGVLRFREDSRRKIHIDTEAVGIVSALEKAAEDVAENFTARSRIAIVEITAQDRSTREFITGELEHILRGQGYTIIDRSQLDRIREEQRFGTSGEVDDNTAASIGRIAGANIVITGRVDGEGNLRRLRLRALDTASGQVVGTASERL